MFKIKIFIYQFMYFEMDVDNVCICNIYVYVLEELIVFQSMIRMIENFFNSFKEEMILYFKQNVVRLVLVLVIINLFICQF